MIAARAADVGRASWTALVRTAELRGHLQEARYYGAGRTGFDDVMEALTGLARTKPEALEREAMVARGGVRGPTCEPTTRIPDRSAGREGDGRPLSFGRCLTVHLRPNLHALLSGGLASLIDQSSRSLQMTGCMAPPWGRLSRPGGDALGWVARTRAAPASSYRACARSTCEPWASLWAGSRPPWALMDATVPAREKQ